MLGVDTILSFVHGLAMTLAESIRTHPSLLLLNHPDETSSPGSVTGRDYAIRLDD